MLDEDYSFVDRLLHRLSLGSRTVSELSFDLDQHSVHAARNAAEIAVRPHVFVTGLARAGTTVLMRAIHDTGAFRSLTYRDMPFPLAPNLWKKLSRRSGPAAAEPRERAHGDRILTSVDSPEAIDEVFWRVHTAGDYIRPDGLLPYRPDTAEMALFRRYVAAVIASAGAGEWRYLSKNNNNILRLPALIEHFPKALFVLPFRAPAGHAASLWRQHAHFCALQRKTPFVRSYMDWLVHHEFGLGHRPFRIGTPLPGLTPDMPDYWLDLWVRVHETLAGFDDPRCIFVGYEALCRDPAVWRTLRAALQLPAQEPAPAFSAGPAGPRDAFSPALLARADKLHGRLLDRAASAVRHDEAN